MVSIVSNDAIIRQPETRNIMVPSIHSLALPASIRAASGTDEAIVTSAKNSHVFRIRLKDDRITTESMGGAAA